MRKYRRPKRQPRIYYPLNQNIRVSQLRVISEQGENLGIMSRGEALGKAREANLDLVVVAEKAQPPVAKILEFGKFLYEKRKEQKEARKGKKQEIKGFRIGPNISEGDLAQRTERILGFLKNGDKVKLSVLFKGRMITRKEIGREKIDKIYAAVEQEGVGEYEVEPRMEGKTMIAVIQPK